MKAQIIRHGEALLKPTTLPKEAALKETSKKVIVAHSETGHNHVLEATKDIKVYTLNDKTYVEVPELSKLWHDKAGNNVHETQKVTPAIYEIIIKKEFDYFANKMREVRD